MTLFKVTSDTFITLNVLLLVARDLSQYVGSSHTMLVMAVYQSDGLEMEAVFQSLGPALIHLY